MQAILQAAAPLEVSTMVSSNQALQHQGLLRRGQPADTMPGTVQANIARLAYSKCIGCRQSSASQHTFEPADCLP